eukprot:TRINITY_DN5516_c0_g1_i1.p1 TRINITY_DN5516_c0_g1~~TRINITY_DN5516_c0_g1_i1.p1  ORF type:complete len:819 (+),score=157.39 TRINITY_DN5516_c0_g1_i1:60-2516(+)
MEAKAGPSSPRRPGRHSSRSKASNKVITANLANTNYAMVRQVVDELGVKQTDDPNAMDCNLLWFDTCPPPAIFNSIKPYQRVNHFPNTGQMTRKDSLARNLNLVSKSCPESINFNFFPRSWILPAEAQALTAYAAKAKAKGKKKTYIYKPTNGARGEGIALTRNVASIPDDGSMLVQEYLSQPYLVDGHKFDLRLYVLISSVDPLRMFLFHDGLVRLSTKAYKAPTAKNMSNTCMHLTNYSINKHSDDFEQTDDADTGSKRSYAWLLQQLRAQGHNVDRLQQRINDCLIKTTIVALPYMFKGYDACKRQARASSARPAAMDASQAAAQASPTSRTGKPQPSLCFEVLGFDIFLSKKLKPYIIEVNRAPSFSCDSQLDTDIKHDVLYASMRLLRMKASDRARCERLARQSSLKRLGKTNSQAALRTTPPSREDQDDKADSDDKEKESTQDRSAFQEWQLQQARWEESRLGGFQRIFPVDDTDIAQEYDQLIRVAFDAVATSKGTAAAAVSAGRRRRLAAAQAAVSIDRPVRRSKSLPHHRHRDESAANVEQELFEAQAAVEALIVTPLRVNGDGDIDKDEELAESMPEENLPASQPSSSHEAAFRMWLSTSWPADKPALRRYYLSFLTIAQRRQIVRQAYRRVMVAVRGGLVQTQVRRRGTAIAQQAVEAIFSKLNFNHGQGLWNTFEVAKDDQKGLLALLQLPQIATIVPSLVATVVTVSQQDLLRHYYSHSLKATSFVSNFDTGTLSPTRVSPSPSKAVPIQTLCLMHDPLAATTSPSRLKLRRRHSDDELTATLVRSDCLQRQALPTPAQLMSSLS